MPLKLALLAKERQNVYSPLSNFKILIFKQNVFSKAFKVLKCLKQETRLEFFF